MSSLEEVEFDTEVEYNDTYHPARNKQEAVAPVPLPAALGATVSVPVNRSQQNILSLPRHHHDPFSVRAGKTLVWKDINMTLVSFIPPCSLSSD